jgi:hypothetical protein
MGFQKEIKRLRLKTPSKMLNIKFQHTKDKVDVH